MRRVKTVREGVLDTLGPPDPNTSVFPLSPSALQWDLFNASCTLKRWLRKRYPRLSRGKAPDYFMRGQILDKTVEAFLQDRIAEQVTADEWSHQAEEVAWETYYSMKDQYQEVTDGWVSEIAGDCVAFIRKAGDTIRADHTQHKLELYIGEEQGVWEELIKKAAKHDIVFGIADWDHEEQLGYVVTDLKCTSSPITSDYSGVGKYKPPMWTYAAALEQQGKTVLRVALCQWDHRKKRVVPVSEQFLSRDYDRIIQQFRVYRDHYLAVEAGTQDFIVPPRGYGECRKGKCLQWDVCPAGGGSFKV